MRLTSTVAVAAAVAAGLSPLAAAFTDTAPFLAFSSRQSAALDRGLVSRSAASPAVLPRDISQSMTGNVDELCGLDAMAIVEVESLGPHAFQALPRDSFLRTRAMDAPSQMAFQHVSQNHGDAASEIRHAVQRTCQKHWRGEKDKVVTMRSGSIDDKALSFSLSSFAEQFPNHVIVVTSASRKLQMSKRASEDEGDGSVMDPKLGLLHRYQFFSTGLLTALLVMVFLLIPAVYFATGLLSNIETPDRLGEKSRSSGEKKMQ